MTYLEDVEVLGVPGFRFITPREVLQDPSVNPENLCYCTRDEGDDLDLDKCSKTGLFYLSRCRKGLNIAYTCERSCSGVIYFHY